MASSPARGRVIPPPFVTPAPLADVAKPAGRRVPPPFVIPATSRANVAVAAIAPPTVAAPAPDFAAEGEEDCSDGHCAIPGR
jgi:hypothetical protein